MGRAEQALTLCTQGSGGGGEGKLQRALVTRGFHFTRDAGSQCAPYCGGQAHTGFARCILCSGTLGGCRRSCRSMGFICLDLPAWPAAWILPEHPVPSGYQESCHQHRHSLCIDARLCPGPWPPRFPKSRAHLSKGEASHPHFGHSSLVPTMTPTRSHPVVPVPPPPVMLCRGTRPGRAETAASRCQRASSGEQSPRGKSIQLNLRESKKKGKHREQMNLTRD